MAQTNAKNCSYSRDSYDRFMLSYDKSTLPKVLELCARA